MEYKANYKSTPKVLYQYYQYLITYWFWLKISLQDLNSGTPKKKGRQQSHEIIGSLLESLYACFCLGINLFYQLNYCAQAVSSLESITLFPIDLCETYLTLRNRRPYKAAALRQYNAGEHVSSFDLACTVPSCQNLAESPRGLHFQQYGS